jgi:hypothetical protein
MSCTITKKSRWLHVSDTVNQNKIETMCVAMNVDCLRDLFTEFLLDPVVNTGHDGCAVITLNDTGSVINVAFTKNRFDRSESDSSSNPSAAVKCRNSSTTSSFLHSAPPHTLVAFY